MKMKVYDIHHDKSYFSNATIAIVSCLLSACVDPKYCHPSTLSGLCWTSFSKSSIAEESCPFASRHSPSSNGLATLFAGLSSMNLDRENIMCKVDCLIGTELQHKYFLYPKIVHNITRHYTCLTTY